MYTDLIGPSVEYEDNEDSRVLQTFLVQTLNGINNYVFGKDDKRLMLQHENVTQMSFWLKFNTGKLITAGYPITLDICESNKQKKRKNPPYSTKADNGSKTDHSSDTRLLQGLAVQRKSGAELHPRENRKESFAVGRSAIGHALLKTRNAPIPKPRAGHLLSKFHCTWRKLLHCSAQVLRKRQPERQPRRVQKLDMPDIACLLLVQERQSGTRWHGSHAELQSVRHANRSAHHA